MGASSVVADGRPVASAGLGGSRPSRPVLVDRPAQSHPLRSSGRRYLATEGEVSLPFNCRTGWADGHGAIRRVERTIPRQPRRSLMSDCQASVSTVRSNLGSSAAQCRSRAAMNRPSVSARHSRLANAAVSPTRNIPG